MPNLASITLSSAKASDPVAVGQLASQIFGLICTISAGAVLKYNVEVTGDASPTAGGNWNPHEVMQGLANSANGNIGYPVTGIRLNVTSWTSGSVTLAIAVGK